MPQLRHGRPLCFASDAPEGGAFLCSYVLFMAEFMSGLAVIFFFGAALSVLTAIFRPRLNEGFSGLMDRFTPELRQFTVPHRIEMRYGKAAALRYTRWCTLACGAVFAVLGVLCIRFR
jgi:hypothetical protein